MLDAADRIRDRIMEIVKVDDFAERKALAEEVAAQAAREIDVLEATIGDLESDQRTLEREAEAKEGEVADAAHALFDEIQRPVGQLRFVVPQTDAANRALLNLHDAIGRAL